MQGSAREDQQHFEERRGQPDGLDEDDKERQPDCDELGLPSCGSTWLPPIGAPWCAHASYYLATAVATPAVATHRARLDVQHAHDMWTPVPSGVHSNVLHLWRSFDSSKTSPSLWVSLGEKELENVGRQHPVVEDMEVEAVLPHGTAKSAETYKYCTPPAPYAPTVCRQPVEEDHTKVAEAMAGLRSNTGDGRAGSKRARDSSSTRR